MGKKITVQAVGGEPQTLENISTVREAKEKLGLPTYTATVNGNPAKDSDSLPDFAYVALAAPVKGGL